MTFFIAAAALAAGFGLGLVVAYITGIRRSISAREISAEILRESEDRRQAETEAILGNIKASFGDMSLEALRRSTDEFMKLAKSRLDLEREAGAKDLGEKKSLIDQQLHQMTAKLEGVESLMNTLEKDREKKFGELTQHLELAGRQYDALSQSTNSLRQALASTKARGQWGERMAEDVLRMAGFVEHVNYSKQKATLEGKIPDFTFFLPKDLKLNMDAKFPLDNYMRYLEAGSDQEKDKYCKDFLKDVKLKVKEVKNREYIDPAGGTVDYALLFIPNEQIYAFIHEKDGSILDSAIKDKIIFCSPVTLFAVLAVVRQAVDNFALERTSNEILGLFGTFKKQWDSYQKAVNSLGSRLTSLNNAYEDVSGVRMRQLEKPLIRMENLRNSKGLPLVSVDESAAIDAEVLDEPALIDGGVLEEEDAIEAGALEEPEMRMI